LQGGFGFRIAASGCTFQTFPCVIPERALGVIRQDSDQEINRARVVLAASSCFLWWAKSPQFLRETA
jgi:hypothetical protein